VMVEHRQIANYVSAIGDKLGLREERAYGLVSTFAADLGNTVLYTSLVRGGILHVLAKGETTDGQRFAAYCREHYIDCMKMTPTHLQALLGEGGGEDRVGWRCLVLGGEVLPRELATRVQAMGRGCRIYNHYGPTECTVGAVSEEVTAGRSGGKGAVPLGRPLGNMRVYILDGDWRVVPVGVVGEIYIGGAGVARGYLKRAEMTAERFVGDPYAGEVGGRMYKTGDLGRWLGMGRSSLWGGTIFK